MIAEDSEKTSEGGAKPGSVVNFRADGGHHGSPASWQLRRIFSDHGCTDTDGYEAEDCTEKRTFGAATLALADGMADETRHKGDKKP